MMVNSVSRNSGADTMATNWTILSIAKLIFHSTLFMILGAIISSFSREKKVNHVISLLKIDSKDIELKPNRSFLTDGYRTGKSEFKKVMKVMKNAEHIRYIPSQRILTAVTAKGGSTSFWKWMYSSLIGKPDFNCSTYIQDVRSSCWEKQAIPFSDMSEKARFFALRDESVFRIAIWRDPFDRLISSWKSKFACEDWIYGTDYPDRARMVPQLLKSASLSNEHVECLNISQFAITLEHVRKRFRKGYVSMEDLNPHIRPQQFFFSYINYSLVVDISQLSNATVFKQLSNRLPFAKNGSSIEHLHASRGPEISIPEHAATLIAKFSKLAEPYPEPIT